MFNGTLSLSRRKPEPLAPPAIGSVPVPPRYFQPADHEARMENMRHAAGFLLDDPTWADELYAFYADLTLDPERDPLEEGDEGGDD